MAGEDLVLSDPLCFLQCMFSRKQCSDLKIIVSDFYSDEDISDARQQLVKDVILMDLSDILSSLTSQQQGESQRTQIVGDLILLLSHLEELGRRSELPKYVSSGPDRLPPAQYDLKYLEQRFEIVTKELGLLRAAVAAISGDVIQHIRCQPPLVGASHVNSLQLPASQSSGSAPVSLLTTHDNPLTAGNPTIVDVGKSTHDPSTPGPVLRPGVRWSSVTSTPTFSQRGGTLNTDSDIDDDNDNAATSDNPFMTYVPPKKRRRQRQRQQQQCEAAVVAAGPMSAAAATRPGSVSGPNQAAVHQQPRRQDQPTSVRSTTAASGQLPHTVSNERTEQSANEADVNKQKRGGPLLIGNRTASYQSLSGAKITAARQFLKKSVYYIDNIDASVTADDLRSFVSGMSINVVSCFEVVPRKSRGQRMQTRNMPVDENVVSKAFRLCIHKEDSERLLDPDMWPAYVRISEWYFKSADQQKPDATGVLNSSAGGLAQNGNPVAAHISQAVDTFVSPSGSLSLTAVNDDQHNELMETTVAVEELSEVNIVNASILNPEATDYDPSACSDEASGGSVVSTAGRHR